MYFISFISFISFVIAISPVVIEYKEYVYISFLFLFIPFYSFCLMVEVVHSEGFLRQSPNF